MSLYEHILVDGATLCGDVDEPAFLPNGSPIPRVPCGDCRAIAQGAHAAGVTPQGAASTLFTPLPPPRGSERVVISMTTVPARNGTLGPTIDSLRRQTRPPDDIRLYHGPGCDPYNDPTVTCISTRDRGPVTKLSAVADPGVPADAIVVTVDDDITFRPDWLATLLQYTSDYPDDALGMAGWNAAPLITRRIFERATGPCDVIEGFAGVAYRKWFFGPEVLDPPASMKFVDDVWISSYLHHAGITRRVVHRAETLVDIKRSVDSGIHTRPDFLELNRQAALTAFVSPPRAALAERRAHAFREATNRKRRS